MLIDQKYELQQFHEVVSCLLSGNSLMYLEVIHLLEDLAQGGFPDAEAAFEQPQSRQGGWALRLA